MVKLILTILLIVGSCISPGNFIKTTPNIVNREFVRQYDVTKDLTNLTQQINESGLHFYRFRNNHNIYINATKHFPEDSLRDYSFETTIRLNSPLPQNDWSLINLTGLQNMDQIIIKFHKIQKTMEFIIRLAGRLTTILIPNINILDNQWHNIKYTLKDNQLNVTIDCKMDNKMMMVHRLQVWSQFQRNTFIGPKTVSLNLIIPDNLEDNVLLDILSMKFQFGSNIIWDSKCENIIEYNKSRESLGESIEELVEPEMSGKVGDDDGGGEVTNSAEVGKYEENWESKYRKFKFNLQKLLNESDTKQPPKIIPNKTNGINIKTTQVEAIGVPVPGVKGEKGERGLTGQCSCDDYCSTKKIDFQVNNKCSYDTSDLSTIKSIIKEIIKDENQAGIHDDFPGINTNQKIDIDSMKTIMQDLIKNNPSLRGPPGLPGMEGHPGIPGTSTDTETLKASVLKEMKEYIHEYIEDQLNQLSTGMIEQLKRNFFKGQKGESRTSFMPPDLTEPYPDRFPKKIWF